MLKDLQQQGKKLTGLQQRMFKDRLIKGMGNQKFFRLSFQRTKSVQFAEEMKSETSKLGEQMSVP